MRHLASHLHTGVRSPARMRSWLEETGKVSHGVDASSYRVRSRVAIKPRKVSAACANNTFVQTNTGHYSTYHHLDSLPCKTSTPHAQTHPTQPPCLQSSPRSPTSSRPWSRSSGPSSPLLSTWSKTRPSSQPSSRLRLSTWSSTSSKDWSTWLEASSPSSSVSYTIADGARIMLTTSRQRHHARRSCCGLFRLPPVSAQPGSSSAGRQQEAKLKLPPIPRRIKSALPNSRHRHSSIM